MDITANSEICEILPNKAVSLPPKDLSNTINKAVSLPPKDLSNTSTYLVDDESKKIGDLEPHPGIIEPRNKQPQKYYNYTKFFVSDGPSTVTENEPKVHTDSTLCDTSSTHPGSRISASPAIANSRSSEFTP